MRYPKFLEKGGTIGFVAPSFGCSTQPYKDTFQNAVETFHRLGFQTKLGPNCYLAEGIGISNSPDKCAEELQDFYESTENDVLISCGGGELMCEILEYLDFERLKRTNPKWYMGFSDNTNFTYLLTTLCDTASIYGPNAAGFGCDNWHPALQDAFSLLQGEKLTVTGYDLWEKESLRSEENPYAPYNVTEPKILQIYTAEVLKMGVKKSSIFADTSKTGGNESSITAKEPDISIKPVAGTDFTGELSFSGRILGGCLDCLSTLSGTVFDGTKAFAEQYKEDGIIWFLEACDLNVFGIRRAMWQLKQSGWFSHVKGFLIGRPLCFGQEMMGLDAYQAFLYAIAEYRVPIVMDVDLGHLSPMMPLVLGSMAEVRVCGNDISIEMGLV